LAACAAFTGCGASGENAKEPAVAARAAPVAPVAKDALGANPFKDKSPLPLEAPPFDRIHDADYQPAIEEGMRRNLAEVKTIAEQKEPPTFANTIDALERTASLLTRVLKVFSAITKADTNEALQKVQADTAPQLAGLHDSIYLDAKLFARVRALFESRDRLGLDAEQLYLVGKYHRDFVLAGARLSDADKTALRALNAEEANLTTEFEKKLLAATNAAAVVVEKRDELDGLDDGAVAVAAEEAKRRGLEGRFVLSLRNFTRQPLLSSLKNRDLRRRLHEAALTRADRGGGDDTRAICQRLAVLRAQKAKLLGFPDYAAYTLSDQMAKTPEAAIDLMTRMVPAATAKARGELAKMQALADAQAKTAGERFPLAAWDWSFYAEQVRKAEFDLDDAVLKPYFALDRVLRDGVFFAANRLYGLTFKERTDVPPYHPDVKVFEVDDADGSVRAIFYADYFARSSKAGGAWEDTFVDASGLLGTKCVVFNVCNFTKPAAGQPALLSFDDVTTMFHEFGHALHAILSDVKYPTLAGTNVPRDFVEFPSQFNEHWATEPSVLASYAKHVQTGAAMPADLVEKIKRSRTFDQGYLTTAYLSAALLDMAWHTLPASAPPQDATAFETEALKRFHVDLAEVPPRYRTPYFAHIWEGGYAAGYYAYLWAEVLDHDAWYWFVEHGGLTRENGKRFRDLVLSRGGTQDAADLFKSFRGRDPSVDPLLTERGLK
jgi:peptidyl-dipeptidase Dcp